MSDHKIVITDINIKPKQRRQYQERYIFTKSQYEWNQPTP